jgi:hypothetical protein
MTFPSPRWKRSWRSNRCENSYHEGHEVHEEGNYSPQIRGVHSSAELEDSLKKNSLRSQLLCGAISGAGRPLAVSLR